MCEILLANFKGMETEPTLNQSAWLIVPEGMGQKLVLLLWRASFCLSWKGTRA